MKSNLLIAATWLWSLRGKELWLTSNVLTAANPDPSAPKLSAVEAISIFAYLHEKGLLLKTTAGGKLAFHLHEAKFREWNSLIEELEQQTEIVRADQIEGKSRLRAIMFTDIVDSTKIADENEPLAFELIEEHLKLVRSIFPKFGGKEIKTLGDGFLLIFESSVEAVKCAVQLQLDQQKRNAEKSSERQIVLRIGIHLGEIKITHDDVFGAAVNVAQRLQSAAEPGQIFVSADVERQVRNKAAGSLVPLGFK